MIFSNEEKTINDYEVWSGVSMYKNPNQVVGA